MIRTSLINKNIKLQVFERMLTRNLESSFETEKKTVVSA